MQTHKSLRTKDLIEQYLMENIENPQHTTPSMDAHHSTGVYMLVSESRDFPF